MRASVEDVFGHTYAIRFRYEDGTARCPLCSYPCDSLDECRNPACAAGPTATIASETRHREDQARRAAEAEERARVLRIRARHS